MKALVFLLCLLPGVSSYAQEVKLINLEELTHIIDNPSKRLKVINFWASWCGPCIKELPFFESLDKDMVEVFLVSLDYPEDKEKVRNLMEKKGIKGPIYLLNEKDADKYMGAIDDNWSGAIPATLFVDSSGKTYFHENAFDQPELEKTVKGYIR